MENYINHCCWKSTIATFRNTDKGEWLERMISSSRMVHPHPAGPEQEKAWGSCFDVLRETFAQLPESYARVWVVFEYTLPKHNPKDEDPTPDPGVRPDVLLLCGGHVVVLEFKQREEAIPHFEKQARKYQYRLQNWHVQSLGMSKHTVLVLTEASGLREDKYHITDCSPDMLGEVLRGMLGDAPAHMSKDRLKEWLGSEYAFGKNRKRLWRESVGNKGRKKKAESTEGASGT